MKFHFTLKDLLPMIEHAKASPDHTMPFGYEETKKGPGLLLVKDSGVYLLSNGTPRQMADGSIATEKQEGSSLVVYADGFGKDTWISGDDYVEFFDLETFTSAIAEGADAIAFDVTPNAIKVLIQTGPKLTMDYALKVVKEWIALEDKLVYLPSRKHKTFRVCSATARQFLVRKFPKALIINEMPMDAAVKLYASVRGISA